MFPSQLYNGVGQLTHAPSQNKWWMDAIAAYQAIHVASYEASKINLANPGTYNLTTPFGGVPTWNTNVGWGFPTGNTIFRVDLYPRATVWSCVIRLANVNSPVLYTYSVAINAYDYDTADRYFGIWFQKISGTMYTRYFCYNASRTEAVYGSGVYALAGVDTYRDGVHLSSIPAASFTFRSRLTIGGLVGLDNVPALWFEFNICAVAIFNRALSAGEVATISAAMAAL